MQFWRAASLLSTKYPYSVSGSLVLKKQCFVVRAQKTSGGGAYYACDDGFIALNAPPNEQYCRPLLIYSTKELAQEFISAYSKAPKRPFSQMLIEAATPELLALFRKPLEVGVGRINKGRKLNSCETGYNIE